MNFSYYYNLQSCIQGHTRKKLRVVERPYPQFDGVLLLDGLHKPK